MKITLDEWLSLEKSARQAREALGQLDNRLTELLLKYQKAGDRREAELLLRIEARVSDAVFDLALSLFYVQSEWTGGDSSNPRNHTLREPNWVTISHSFPPEQVDKYRDLGTGEIRIPHRDNQS